MQWKSQFHEINKMLKPLLCFTFTFICCHENARFSSLVKFRRRFTIERVQRTVGNCIRNLILKINLWKGVLFSIFYAEIEESDIIIFFSDV